MSTLEEHIDVGVPLDTAWACLHRAETYPRFLDGVREARSEGEHRTHLDIDAGGQPQECVVEITDRSMENVMRWQTTSGPDLAGTFSLLPIDEEHTRVQARFEYDPGTIKEAFGGPQGFAQASAIERGLRSDLQQLKRLVEQER
ncbi:SRPBCC family protein [Streptomyces sp. Je 1-4]|uniref:SRPBCC family protein n=1 Tax=Streptomyces TaxID=1883 RepID=UPI00140ED46F|nr:MULTISPECIES: SRPBCC family protein [unclassified Streptomyces]QIK10479.1 cyclase [Streptomyces sp. ID38640]UYB44261.1 SRPBCC family protein [Streptomyces sp. Je 1-4]UZQ40710.1 SRPBCC family protein [Streptomyces sp. Je 1-4] [Streptomyces sp. Je 1-4 4N24]UZQ48127.1 SRPBCC family protein [Streptomyces sp. Je 1-4] [Streptomyces sp. Je 1-4 4N24_ara]